MRLIKKFGIFFRLKKEETIEWFQNVGLPILAVFIVTGLLVLIVAILSSIIGIIAIQFYRIEEWVIMLDLNKEIVMSFFDVGMSLFLYVWMIGSGIILCLLLFYWFGKWIYSNWKLAEKELIKQEKKR